MWTVGCQTCGMMLGDDPSALCVDDSIVSAAAYCPDDGWRVIQPFSARRFFLFRHEDGRKLVLSYSEVMGGGWAETDSEAKVRAAGVLSFRAGLTGLDWVLGPGTPGSVTLYGRAR